MCFCCISSAGLVSSDRNNLSSNVCGGKLHLCTHTHRCFATGFVCAKIATDTWKTRCLRDLTCFLHPSDERLKFKFTSEFSEFPQKPTVQMYREAKYRLAKEVGMIQPRQDRSGVSASALPLTLSFYVFSKACHCFVLCGGQTLKWKHSSHRHTHCVL